MSNLGNFLTLSRIVAAPIFLYLIIKIDSANATISTLAAVVVVITLLTDMFDGIVARAQNNVTNFGKIMDPFADSIFFMTALFAFSASERFDVPIWLPIIVLYREMAMHILRRYAALSGVVLAAKLSGKIKMVVQSFLLVAITTMLAVNDNGWCELYPEEINTLIFWAISIIATVNVLSMVGYISEIPKLKEHPSK